MISIVTDLVHGDSGKGKIAAYLSKDADIIVRAGGGPNAGHKFDGTNSVCQLPSGVHNENLILCVGRGTVINPTIVLDEINKYNVHSRTYIDPGCTIIENEDIEAEKELIERIGSVGTGIGPARVKRILRTAKIAKDIPELKPYLRDVSKFIIENKRNKKIVIEGVQGYSLDLYDSRFYPFVTSQSTLASQFAADCGIGPLDIDYVYGACKIYTSRVAAGYMYNEWTQAQKDKYGIDERGTISGRVRRIGDFDFDLVKDAINANSVSHLVINCVDVFFPSVKGCKETLELPLEVTKHINEILNRIGWYGPVILGVGPNPDNMIRYSL